MTERVIPLLEPTPRRTDWLKVATVVALALAIIAAVTVALAGYGYSWGWWGVATALFGILPAGAYIGVPAALVALIAGAIGAFTRRWIVVFVMAIALLLALGAVGLPLSMKLRSTAAPNIHDITTDMMDPPAFVALKQLRDGTPNGSTYGGSIVADQQRKAYGDIAPVMLAVSPGEAMDKATRAALDMGWQVVASDADQLEATATTPWFGFKDDIIVRVRAVASGSKVDIRSVSRIGSSDLGTNARRVREFIARLQQK